MSETDERIWDRVEAEAGDTPRIEVQCLSCGRFGSFEGDDARVRGTPLVRLPRLSAELNPKGEVLDNLLAVWQRTRGAR